MPSDLDPSQIDRGPSPQCPVPIPNFSSVPKGSPTYVPINLVAAQSRGFTPTGADQMYVQDKAPSAPSDRLVLSRFASDRPKAHLVLGSPSLSPRQALVLIDRGAGASPIRW